MITYQYTQKDWTTFKEGIKREWAVTNGIGGYAGSSMIGAHSRTHQGYLIASLHAPIERYLVFSKINETATVGTSTVSFETSQHCASGKTEGNPACAPVCLRTEELPHLRMSAP